MAHQTCVTSQASSELHGTFDTDSHHYQEHHSSENNELPCDWEVFKEGLDEFTDPLPDVLQGFGDEGDDGD